MHILLTGGSGKLGAVVVEHLLDAGHTVTNVDIRPGADPRARFLRIDLTDYGQVVEALTGIDERYDAVDAVVHLAAIPAPGLTANAATFANNIAATYHVFPAAERPGSATWSGRPARPCSGCRSTTRRRTCRWTRTSRRGRNRRTRW